MQPVFIADPDDPRVTPFRSIGDAELLRTRDLFVAEGRLVVERVLADAAYAVHSLLLNGPSRKALEPVLRRSGFDGPVFECATAAFEAITGYNIHRGCLALVHRPPVRTWRDIVSDAGRVIVLEGVTNADNVGSVFRNAAAFGVDAVLLDPACCDPLYRKAIRTSMAAVLRVPFARADALPAVLDELRAEGIAVAALSPREPSVPLQAFAPAMKGRRVALVVGSEGPGLSDEVEASADVRVSIPMTNAVDSLNLAVATGIALWMLSDVSAGT